MTAERDHLEQEVQRLQSELSTMQQDREDLLNLTFSDSSAPGVGLDSTLLTTDSLAHRDTSSLQATAGVSHAAEALLKERMKRGEQKIAQLQTKVRCQMFGVVTVMLSIYVYVYLH